MLGQGPAGLLRTLVPALRFETLLAFEPPRQQPLAAACPSLSKEGSHFHPWVRRPAGMRGSLEAVQEEGA